MNQIVYRLNKGDGLKKKRIDVFLQKSRKIPFIRWFTNKIYRNRMNIPDDCYIGLDFNITSISPSFLSIGKNVSLNDTFIVAWAPVIIGNNVAFSFKNTIITSTHDLNDFNRVIGKPIVIGSNVWVTSNVTILPGVTIGDNTVIGAGSVVTQDIPSGVLAAGNPCRVIKKINFQIK